MKRRYDREMFTYGVELEYADVYRFNELPKGNQWNTQDNTVVNSTGIANDPYGKIWEYGGEINTRPTNTVLEQVEEIEKIKKVLNPKPWINYRCNLHIHIGVKGLHKDLHHLKKLLRYITKYQKEAFRIVEPIPIPILKDFKNKEEHKGAMKRYRRRTVSHQHCLNEKTVKNILDSKTPKEFWDNHAQTNKDGKRMWFITPRAGINLRQLFETNTLEFRHFPGTTDKGQMYSCLLWCREFLHAALTSHKITPQKIYEENKMNLTFPKFKRYDHKIDKLWRVTNLGKNTRKEAEAAIKKIVKDGLLLDIEESQERSSKIESGYTKGITSWI